MLSVIKYFSVLGIVLEQDRENKVGLSSVT